MPTPLTDLVLRMGSITGLSMADINSDAAETATVARPGTLSIVVDAYGYRIFQYVKNVSDSAYAMGELVTKTANTAVNNQTGTVTTSATTTGLTANDHIGRLAYVLDDAGAAGAAPEGETTVVADNTATVISFDPKMPLSVALASGDDLVLISNWQSTDSADGDLAHNVLGVVVGNAGFSDNQYGWVQKEGYCPNADTTGGAITAGDPIVANTAQVGQFGSDGQELWVGIALATGSSDQAAAILPVNLKLFTTAGPGTAP